MKATVQAGFSLFEVLLAVALLGVCLLLVTRASMRSLTTVSSSYLLNKALLNAQGYVELAQLQWLPSEYWHSDIIMTLPKLKNETSAGHNAKQLRLSWQSPEQFAYCQSQLFDSACLTLNY